MVTFLRFLLQRRVRDNMTSRLHAMVPSPASRTAVALVAFVTVWIVPTGAKAGVIISPSLQIEANLMIQSVIVDSEVAFLQPFIHLGPNDTLLYTSLTSAAGWSGTLTGTYAGGSLAINYTGTITGDPDISVGADGSVSAELYKSEWKGSENISEGLNGETTFGIGLDGSIGVGVNIPLFAGLSAKFTADKDNPLLGHELKITAGAEVGVGKHFGIDWTLADAALFYTLDQVTLETTSGWEVNAAFGWYTREGVLNVGTHGDPSLGLPVHDRTFIRVVAVPEPSSLVLFGVGSFGLFMCTWRRRKVGCPT
jgi:hypothetical protein